MKRLCWVTMAVAVAAVVAAPVLYGQGSRGGAPARGTGPGLSSGARPGMGTADPERMKMMAERFGLNEQEQVAVQKAMQAKFKARQALQEELGKLRQVAFGDQATEQGLNQAIASYTKAMVRYRETVQTADRALAGRLSAKSRARCLVAGILDNELGAGGGTGPVTGTRRGSGPGGPPDAGSPQ